MFGGTGLEGFDAFDAPIGSADCYVDFACGFSSVSEVGEDEVSAFGRCSQIADLTRVGVGEPDFDAGYLRVLMKCDASEG